MVNRSARVEEKEGAWAQPNNHRSMEEANVSIVKRNGGRVFKQRALKNGSQLKKKSANRTGRLMT